MREKSRQPMNRLHAKELTQAEIGVDAPEWTTVGTNTQSRKVFIMTLAQKLKFAREELNYSQHQMAKLLKTNQTMICLMERGYVPVTHQQAIAELENLYAFLKGEKK